MGLFNDNKRHVKELDRAAEKVLALEEEFLAKTDEELKEETKILKKRIQEDGESLDNILPRAYALVREASSRVLKMRHFKTQIMGGIALHQGRIAEMRTGEGKTLVSTLPAFLNALNGKGVHVITVNDYLASRDAAWMGKVHRFLGLTVGVSLAGQQPDQKRRAYNCDITYCTNNELGFDYLRDNIQTRKQDRVLRSLDFAIIDEIDSILIDEARTPLIISGPGNKSSDGYINADRFVRKLVEADYDLDIEKKSIRLSDSGVEKAEKFFNVENLGDIENLELHHYINNSLRAHVNMKKDDNYIVSDSGEILIVDEFTGRVMEGRRYSDGLHQAIEAKEGVEIKNENQTMATITFQNLFRMYRKISGMTGTAKTEEGEFNRIYNLDVVTIPTNLPMIRKDAPDIVYVTMQGKYKAIVEDALNCYKSGQPVLVGTVTIDKSEEISKAFKHAGIKHNVLNAKNHTREAEIVAQAGRKGAVTIATNMAGRGTDILLGGNAEFLAKQEMRAKGNAEELIESATSYISERTPEEEAAKKEYDKLYEKYKEITNAEKEEVKALGGLRIIGTERHESRRIDNQLRGRAGRQGDPGESVFYISLEDDLIKRFGGDKLKNYAQRFRVDENMPFQMTFLSNRIEGAQKRIEGAHFGSRRQVIEYDDVLNKQRLIIYGERNEILDGEDMHPEILTMIDDLVKVTVEDEIDDNKIWSEWNLAELNKAISEYCLRDNPEFLNYDNIEGMEVKDVVKFVQEEVKANYEKKIDFYKETLGLDFKMVERDIMLKVVDKKWIDHIDAMTILKNEIWMRSFAQHNPVDEYKAEGHDMYDDMTTSIKSECAKILLNIEVKIRKDEEELKPKPRKIFASGGGENHPGAGKAIIAKSEKTAGRNDACPCGSGKKYKQCCGK